MTATVSYLLYLDDSCGICIYSTNFLFLRDVLVFLGEENCIYFFFYFFYLAYFFSHRRLKPHPDATLLNVVFLIVVKYYLNGIFMLNWWTIIINFDIHFLVRFLERHSYLLSYHVFWNVINFDILIHERFLERHSYFYLLIDAQSYSCWLEMLASSTMLITFAKLKV